MRGASGVGGGDDELGTGDIVLFFCHISFVVALLRGRRGSARLIGRALGRNLGGSALAFESGGTSLGGVLGVPPRRGSAARRAAMRWRASGSLVASERCRTSRKMASRVSSQASAIGRPMSVSQRGVTDGR